MRRHKRLVVDWDDPGARWQTVVRVPLGAGRHRLGVGRYRGQDPIVPSAFAVTPEGFAIMDPAKRRVVLVDPDGRIVRTWTGIAEQASDIAWDETHARLVVIDHESDGRLAELDLNGSLRTASVSPYPVFRLVATPAGVMAQGARGPDLSSDVYHEVPEPVSALTGAHRDLLLSDTERLTLEPRSRDGDSWQIARSGKWRLDLDYMGRNGPRHVIAPLREDPSIDGSRLVLSTVAGTFVSNVRLTHRLVVTQVNLATGQVQDSQQVATCGLTKEANVVSRISTYKGATYQLCVSPEAVEIRRRPK